MTEFANKRISVIGAARSGIAAAQVLTQLGAAVLLSDSKSAEVLGATRIAEIEATGAAFVLGADVAAALPPGTELVVTSPGVPRTAAVLQAAVERGIPVWSEIELAYRITDAPIVAVTGTNGKTTTTMLIAAMLEAGGKSAIVCGNISADEIKRTLVDAAFETRSRNDHPILVAEISSFQLEWVDKFAPKVGVLTNISRDHLDRYHSFEDYARTKTRLFHAQGRDDWAVVNFKDQIEWGIYSYGHNIAFTTTEGTEAEALAYLENETVYVRLEELEPGIAIMPISDIPFTLPGAHSIENVLAAAPAALIMGTPQEAIARAVREFRGVAHRMEFVAEVGGVRYINNSMCTNVAAALRSLEAMDRPTVAIMGGVDKGSDFAPLAPVLQRKTKQVLLIGRDAEKMERAFVAGGYAAIERAATLEEAVQRARQKALPGEAVLLCPACASFDMFRDFEARGAAFRKAVQQLLREDV